MIEGLDERKHLLLLALLGFMYVVLGTFSIFSLTMNYVSWFMVVYLIAVYIRLYPKKLWENRALWGSLTLLFMGLASASIVLCMRKGVETGTFRPYNYVADSNTFYAVAVAVCTVIDLVRIRVLEKPFFRLWDKIAAGENKTR